ncbi:MAG: flagella basal body P-ring formation protein FlgA [Parasphingorhabdus sp.]|uniref:flagella basal body P-ring formation protein FlgA n=1 Tax=Parasphingorhabdus sp. TaxID=2709688 RepID=UPI00329A4BEF
MAHYRFIVPILSVFAIGAVPTFEDTAQLDRQVARHLNATIGSAGGARAEIDRKLRLKRCPSPVQLSDTNNNAVLVSCADKGWRIFVPIRSRSLPATNVVSRNDDFIIRRNQPLTLVVRRANFSISYGVVAQKNGRIGDFIPVRASRKSKVLMAKVSGSGEVELAQ